MNIEGLYLVTTRRNLMVFGPDQVERCMYNFEMNTVDVHVLLIEI